MAVTRFILEKYSGGETADGKSYTLEYLALTNDPLDGVVTVKQSPLLPFEYGDPLVIGNDVDNDVFVTDIDVEPVDANRQAWSTKFEFTTPEDGAAGSNPFDQPPDYEWLFNQHEETIEQDIFGKPIRNTAGDEFDEIHVREDSQPVLQLTRYEPATDLFRYWDIRDCINRSPYLFAPRRAVKFQPPRAVSQYSPQWGLYYEKRYQLKFAAKDWNLTLLNAGLNELIDGKLRRMKDKDGADVTEPYSLDRLGKRLIAGQPEVWLEFVRYPETNLPLF